jgi:hypothetical protein
VQVVVVQRCGPRHAAAILGLALAAFGLACGAKREPVETVPPLRVRVGSIAPDAYDAVSAAPAEPVERIERLVDLFFQAGCVGDQLKQPRPAATAHHPDVVCRLPGRTDDVILVAAYVDPNQRNKEDWSGAALLPQLYRSLAIAPRQHTYVFVGVSDSSRHGLRSDAQRIADVDGDHLRALVDLQFLRGGTSKDLLFSTTHESLRLDLGSVGAAVGMPREALRYVSVPESYRDDERPAISIASPLPPVAAKAVATPDRVAERDAYQATGRTISVYLAYLDDTLRIRSDEPPPPVSAESLPAAPPAPPEPL